MENEPRTLAMFIHLSCLLNCLLPPCGYIVPVLIWQLKKDEIPELDAHGKMVLNFLISTLIYYVVGGMLCIVLIGIPIVIAVYFLSIIFPIIGAVKANDGIVWDYPLTIKFFR